MNIILYCSNIIIFSLLLVYSSLSSKENNELSKKIKDEEKILYIHIGKCGGKTVRKILKVNNMYQYFNKVHDEENILIRYKSEHILITVRDPVTRFISAFNWRRNDESHKNSFQEKEIFKYMKNPNQLAEALTSINEEEQKIAINAMKTIHHLKKSIDAYLGGQKKLKKYHRAGVKFYVIRTENLNEDTERAIRLIFNNVYGITDLNLVTEVENEHITEKTPENTFMSEKAVKNIQNWYKNDYPIIEFLNFIKQ